VTTPPTALVTRRSCLGLLTLGALSGCAAVAADRPVASAPSDKERELGRDAAEEVKRTTGLVKDAALIRYVTEIGRRLVAQSGAPDPGYVFAVVDDSELNAFSLPGGYVHVTRGLLAMLNTEDELAGVLGHEIGHVLAHHSVRRASAATPFEVLFGLPAAALGVLSPGLGGVVAGAGALAGGLVLAPFSRDQEREADQIGMELAAKAGWDPRGLSASLGTLARASRLAGADPDKTGFFSTHPATGERAMDTERAAARLARGAGAPIAGTRPAFLSRLEGLVVGADPAAGVFVGSQFLHPDLGFAWKVPDRWATRNTPELVGASDRDGRAATVLQQAAEGGDPIAGARADGVEESQLRRLPRVQVGGLPAVRAVADSRESRLDLTWIAFRGQVYRIAGIAGIGSFERYRETFVATARTFRPLTEAERAGIVVARLRARPAEGGETAGDVAKRFGGVWNAGMAAVANGVEAEARLARGFPVKVPVRQPYAPPR
jgi:predicted Zn-dependent protease